MERHGNSVSDLFATPVGNSMLCEMDFGSVSWNGTQDRANRYYKLTPDCPSS